MTFKGTDIKTILVIDDDTDEFLLIHDAMMEIDPLVKVYFADSCEEAKKYSDYKFDLVLLDINMPGSDGFTWLKAIREKGYQDLPIIMYTNSMSPLHIRKAYSEGANLYYVKPDNFSKLTSGLSKLLSLDWTHPKQVTRRYHHSGQYLTFT